MPDAGDPSEDGVGLSETLPGLPMGSPVSLSVRRSGDLAAGARIGPYEVRARIGEGGMGVIYEAQDLLLGRCVAIKLLRCPSKDYDQPGDLLLEARAAASLEHERFVRIYGLETLPGGQPYLIMERLRGDTLRAWLRGGRPLGQVALVFQALLDGMAYAHRRGIVHRDLKPENVFLSRQDQVKILDLGLAGLYEEPRTSTVRDARLVHLSREAAGTPAYLAPESWSGAQPGPEVDVWAIGVMLYEALSGGQHPFWRQGCSPGENIDRVQRAPLQPLPRSTAPPELEAIVQRALERDPQDRYRDAEEMRAALGRWMKGAEAAGLPPRARPGAGLWLAGLALVAGGVVVSRAPWNGLRVRAAGELQQRPGMALIRGGRFVMGSTSQEVNAAFAACQKDWGEKCRPGIFERQMPDHEVVLSPYYLDLTEVTNAQFANWIYEHQGWHLGGDEVRDRDGTLLVRLDPVYHGLVWQDRSLRPRPGLEQFPVVSVTWDAAQRYCEAQHKRLPTEAEWEYAARGAERRLYPWGDAPPACAQVVFGRLQHGCPGGVGPEMVGAAAQDRTPLGVLDLGGNVAEWVMDRFSERYATCLGSCSDPQGDQGDGNLRVVRGGSWARAASDGRGADRSRYRHGETFFDLGFRCAASPLP